ncbi:MAG: CBS domain-containing protein [Pseudomonadota bacterium]
MATVAEMMTRDVRTLAPQDSVVKAAQAMAELNVGAIPVCEGERLVGMVTDRDIVLRSVAREVDPAACKLSDVMSGHVRTVHEGDDVDDVLAEMGTAQIRRMPVVDSRDRLVGIISLGDIAAKNLTADADVAASLGDISEPSEPDRSGGTVR